MKNKLSFIWFTYQNYVHIAIFCQKKVWIGFDFEKIKEKSEQQKSLFFKLNSVQEACAKCFAVHLLKFEILQMTWKKMKEKTLVYSFSSIDLIFWWFFYVVSNFNMYVNRKAFFVSFLYWFDFNCIFIFIASWKYLTKSSRW